MGADSHMGDENVTTKSRGGPPRAARGVTPIPENPLSNEEFLRRELIRSKREIKTLRSDSDEDCSGSECSCGGNYKEKTENTIEEKNVTSHKEKKNIDRT